MRHQTPGEGSHYAHASILSPAARSPVARRSSRSLCLHLPGQRPCRAARVRRSSGSCSKGFRAPILRSSVPAREHSEPCTMVHPEPLPRHALAHHRASQRPKDTGAARRRQQTRYRRLLAAAARPAGAGLSPRASQRRAAATNAPQRSAPASHWAEAGYLQPRRSRMAANGKVYPPSRHLPSPLDIAVVPVTRHRRRAWY